MATPTFGRSAATQLTASTTGTVLDVSAGFEKDLYFRHSNGTGSVTTQGTAAIQVKPNGGTFVTIRTITFSPTAAAPDSGSIPLPKSSVAAQVVYTQPGGTTGQTLDYEVGTMGVS